MNQIGIGRAPSWRTIVGVALLAALPILITPIPLLIDFPSHIARFHVERDIAASPALQLNFAHQWRFLPNLGVDLIVALLGRMIDIESAARFAAALIPAIGAAGILLMGRGLHGRLTIGTMLALPLVYAYPLVFGFVNSCLAVSLAFLIVGAWLMLGPARSRARTLLALVAAPIVLTTHIIGFGAMGLMVAGAALAEETASRRAPRAIMAGLARSTLPFAWPLLILMLWRTDTASSGRWFDWYQTGIWLVNVLRDRFAIFDIGSIAILYAVVLLPLIARRRFGVAPAALYAGGLLWLAVLALPGRAFGSEFASVRLVPVALALSLLAVREKASLPRYVLGAVAMFVAVRFVVTATSLLSASDRAERELAVLPNIPSGARVAAVEVVPCARTWAPPRLGHLMSYATIRRDAFVNGQFAAVAGQTLSLKPRIDPGLANLFTIATVDPCPRFVPHDSFPRTLTRLPWDRIDFLWIIASDPTPVAVPARARLMWRGEAGSRLYRITPQI